mgnify:CR=1 FL=1
MASAKINATEGKLLTQIIRFTIPLILTNVFQQLYNIIDNMIAGKFAGETTLAAIGATILARNSLQRIFSSRKSVSVNSLD